ncbi:MAG TPA: type VI secretion system baseplate subunit TssE [Gammaproteobacteria bacterium]|nr:type VI secretion system baseplate subunit TssE [Gammaproteobacteria bacterium]
MAEERLLKRLRRWSAGTGSGIPDVGSYVESVLADVAKLYNTRQGSVPISDRYGLPDISNLLVTLTPPDLERIRDALEQTTGEFEPRLQDVQVTLPAEEALGVLRFMVQGNLLYEKTSLPVRFQVDIEGDGRVSIRR